MVLERGREPLDSSVEPPILVCSVDADGPVSAVRVRGELDVQSAPLLLAVVDDQIARGRVDLRLELEELAFCDLRGIRALEACRRRVRAAGGRFTARGARAFVRYTAALCGAGSLLD